MRLKLAIILMLGLPSVAAAQHAPRATADPRVVPLPSIGLPLPRIGLPLPEIVPPLPEIAPPLPGIAPPVRGVVRAPGMSAPHPNDGNRPRTATRRQHPSVVYVVPAFGWPASEPLTASAPTAAADGPSVPYATPPGHLRLEVVDTGASQQQLYADSYYLGTFDDFSGELELDPGLHVIEIQALGYETLRFEVNISSGRSLTYRGTLKATQAAIEPAVVESTATAPVAPLTVYIVPGCYIGNVPPEQTGLPAGCDARRVITRQQ